MECTADGWQGHTEHRGEAAKGARSDGEGEEASVAGRHVERGSGRTEGSHWGVPLCGEGAREREGI